MQPHYHQVTKFPSDRISCDTKLQWPFVAAMIWPKSKLSMMWITGKSSKLILNDGVAYGKAAVWVELMGQATGDWKQQGKLSQRVSVSLLIWGRERGTYFIDMGKGVAMPLY